MKKKLAVIGIILLLAAFFIYFYTHDPSNEENLFVKCTFKAATGWDCPGCGGQRAVHHLLHFEWGKAFRYNALFVLLLPYLGILFYYETRRIFWKIPIPTNFLTSNILLWVLLILLLLFLVLRNLPLYPFTLLGTP